MRKGILCFLFIINVICLFSITEQIHDINPKIEEVFFEIKSYNFNKSYQKLDSLISECNNANYLIGEAEVLNLKIKQAVALGDEELISLWHEEYNQKIQNTIKYGLFEKEIYYKILSLIFNIHNDGVSYHKDTILQLIDITENKEQYSYQTFLLYSLWTNLTGQEKKDVAESLDMLFSEHIELKYSWIYINYNMQLADKLITQLDLEYIRGLKAYQIYYTEDELLLFSKLNQFMIEGNHNKALEMLMKAYEKDKINFKIINAIGNVYLHLNLQKKDDKHLKKAEYYLMLALDINSQNFNVHYDLACLYSLKKNINKSLHHLNKSIELGNFQLHWILTDPDLSNVRASSKFDSLIAENSKLNLSKTILDYYTEIKIISKRSNLNMFYIISDFAYYFYDQFSRPGNNVNDIMKRLEEIQTIELNLYLQYSMKLAPALIYSQQYTLAEQILLDYIQLTLDYYNQKKPFITNIVNYYKKSRYSFRSSEKVLAEDLYQAYSLLATMNFALSNILYVKEDFDDPNFINKIELSCIDSYIDFTNKSISQLKILEKYGLLITTYLDLAACYTMFNNSDDSKYCLEEAIRCLDRVTNSDCEFGYCRIYYSILISDYFLYHDIHENTWQYHYCLDLLNNAYIEAKENNNLQYQYDIILNLLILYNNSGKEQDLQYDLFTQIDSLITNYKIERDRNSEYTFKPILFERKEFNKIEQLTEDKFYHYIDIGDYDNALGSINDLKIYIYSYNYDERIYKKMEEWVNTLETKVSNRLFNNKLNLFKFDMILEQSYATGNYENGLKLIDTVISIRDSILSLNDLDITDDYIDCGMTLLNLSCFDNDTLSFNKLLPIIQPLQWEYAKTIGSDLWMIQFYNTEKGPLNEKMYNQYMDRILSYPLSKDRIESKMYHGNVLVNLYGDFVGSIRVYEEALQEAKRLNKVELELEILGELAIRYGRNFQSELAKRRFDQALELAEYLENDTMLSRIYPQLFDYVLKVDDDSYYEVAIEYLNHARNVGYYIGEIQAISTLLNYFSYIQDSENAIKYMLDGFSIKDSIIIHVSELVYLSFVSECFNYINNDYSGDIVDPITDWVFHRIQIKDPNLQKIYEEMVYLKDFNFNSLDQMDINSVPFIFIDTLNNSIRLREFWDNDYLQTLEFKENIDFLLNLDQQWENSGLMNAFWNITSRLEIIEEWKLNDKFFGFGFQYNLIDSPSGLKITSIFSNSPSSNKLEVDDILLINEEELTRENAKKYLESKINESDILLDKAATFTVLRNNSETLHIEIMPGDVQPNPYSEYPTTEVLDLVEAAFKISEELLLSTENIHSYPAFANSYRKFLIAHPWRYQYTHEGNGMCTDEVLSLLDKYETIATYDLISESIKHKDNLNSNLLLYEEYNKYSNEINRIQVELQDEYLSQMELEELSSRRKVLYNELEYFENYSLEKADKNSTFSLKNEIECFNEFDVIFRFCASDHLNNGCFLLSPQEASFYYTATESELNGIINSFIKQLKWSISNPVFIEHADKSLIEITNLLNGGPMLLPDEIKANIPLNILVIPEQSMNHFPFELIQFRYTSDTLSYHYLGEIANITYAPSLNTYAQFAKSSNEVNDYKSALIVSANPEIQSTYNYMNNLIALRSDYGNIKFVDNEVVVIGEILSKDDEFNTEISVDVIDSKNISEKAFKAKDLEKFNIIHIAAHGVHDDENPKYSSILLGKNKSDFDDGLLQAHEIFPLNLNADLVTLSSCFSGFGEIDPNEGNLGIYRSFLLAGAKSVIISLWDVEDRSTSILFTKFYQFLREGKSKAEALRMAKMYLKEETEYNNPFYWAPFILIGNN